MKQTRILRRENIDKPIHEIQKNTTLLTMMMMVMVFHVLTEEDILIQAPLHHHLILLKVEVALNHPSHQNRPSQNHQNHQRKVKADLRRTLLPPNHLEVPNHGIAVVILVVRHILMTDLTAPVAQAMMVVEAHQSSIILHIQHHQLLQSFILYPLPIQSTQLHLPILITQDTIQWHQIPHQ